MGLKTKRVSLEFTMTAIDKDLDEVCNYIDMFVKMSIPEWMDRGKISDISSSVKEMKMKNNCLKCGRDLDEHVFTDSATTSKIAHPETRCVVTEEEFAEMMEKIKMNEYESTTKGKLPHIEQFKAYLKGADNKALGRTSAHITEVYRALNDEVKERQLGWSPGTLRDKRPRDYYIPYVITMVAMGNSRHRGMWHIENDKCTFLKNRKKKRREARMTAPSLIAFWNRYQRDWVSIHEKCYEKIYKVVKEVGQLDVMKCSSCGTLTYRYTFTAEKVGSMPVCDECIASRDVKVSWVRYRTKEL